MICILFFMTMWSPSDSSQSRLLVPYCMRVTEVPSNDSKPTASVFGRKASSSCIRSFVLIVGTISNFTQNLLLLLYSWFFEIHRLFLDELWTKQASYKSVYAFLYCIKKKARASSIIKAGTSDTVLYPRTHIDAQVVYCFDICIIVMVQLIHKMPHSA